MGEENDLSQLVMATGEDDSPDRDEATPPATPARNKHKVTTSDQRQSSENQRNSLDSPAKESSSTHERTLTPPLSRISYVNEKAPSYSRRASSERSRVPSGRSAGTRLHKQRKAELLGRPVQHHSFLSDGADVRGMEKALLNLLEDFHSGKLRAFGQDCSMEQMEAIREQQERLARLHFDLGAQQELYAPLSDEGLRTGQENLHRLMGALEQLSLSIERLHSGDLQDSRADP